MIVDQLADQVAGATFEQDDIGRFTGGQGIVGEDDQPLILVSSAVSPRARQANSRTRPHAETQPGRASVPAGRISVRMVPVRSTVLTTLTYGDVQFLRLRPAHDHDRYRLPDQIARKLIDQVVDRADRRAVH